MSLYSLSSRLRRGPEALERTVHFLLGMSTTLLSPGVSPGAAGTTGRAGKRRQLPPFPFPRKMRAHPHDGVSLASDMSSSPLLKQRTPEFLLAALLL